MRCVAAALLLLAPTTSTSAQTTRTSASPVRIEFRALDEAGQPVVDLTPSDLALKVNGKPRALQSLTLFRSSGESVGPVALPPPYATNVAAARGRVLHVLIDDDSIAAGREPQIRDAVRMLTAELSPADRFGLLTTQASINISPTGDITRVRLAADGFTGKARAAETDVDAQCRTRRVLAALGTMISLAGATPTTIVVFSSGVSLPAVKQVKVGSGSTAGTSELCPVEPDDFATLGSVAASARADLYLLQVTEGRAAHSSAQDAGFESLAGATGAEFVRLAGSPQSAMAKLLRETAAYYVATFDAEPGERNGQTSRIELKSSRDQVTLRTRPSVVMPKEVAAKAAPQPKDMLRVAAEFTDLPLRAVSYASRLGPGSDDVRIVALFENPGGAPFAAASVGLFDETNTLKKQWTAQKQDLSQPMVRADLQAPPGHYRVRVAAIDAKGRAGTADDDLDAHTARADPLMLSALVVGTQRQGGGFVPKLQFGRDSVAIGLLEIYGVPKNGNVAVNLDVVSTPDGQPLATAETQIGPGPAEDARTAIGGFGIDNLPAGDYLMRAIVLLDGRPVGKAVRTLRKAR